MAFYRNTTMENTTFHQLTSKEVIAMERYDINYGEQEEVTSARVADDASQSVEEQPYQATSLAEEEHNETYYLLKRFYGMYE